MPKERLHLLLADEALRLLETASTGPPLDGSSRSAYMLGSIGPDTLFYDIPSLKLHRTGNAYHYLQDEAVGLPFFKSWLTEERDRLTTDEKAWILGFAGHLIMDGVWHPQIDRLTVAGPCIDMGGGPRNCHHWVESELEGFWIAEVGPKDGYIPLLAHLGAENNLGYMRLFRRFMQRAGIANPPSIDRLAKCVIWQTRLLRGFATKAAGRLKPILAKSEAGRYPASLTIPLKPILPRLLTARTQEVLHVEDLCGRGFMSRAVRTLSDRLSELLERF